MIKNCQFFQATLQTGQVRMPNSQGHNNDSCMSHNAMPDVLHASLIKITRTFHQQCLVIVHGLCGFLI